MIEAEKAVQLHPTLVERFWKFTDKKGEDECWPWKLKPLGNGYGRIKFKRKTIKAHRLSFLIHYGAFPEGKPRALHKCDNPICVNPSHLFAGSDGDNVRDCVRKKRYSNGFGRGRINSCRGERCPLSKLKADIVLQIRNLCIQGISQKQIAKLFNISPEHVSKISLRKVWGHL